MTNNLGRLLSVFQQSVGFHISHFYMKPFVKIDIYEYQLFAVGIYFIFVYLIFCRQFSTQCRHLELEIRAS